MTSSTFDRADRAAQSRRALGRRYPDLVPVLSQPLLARPIEDADGVIDLAFGEGRYYGGDGRALALAQVEAYLRQPVRLSTPPPESGDAAESAIYADFLAALHAACRQREIETGALPAYPDRSDPLLVVVGLGLGHHLGPLVEGTGARTVIIVDTHVEFVRQSVAVVDWERLLALTEGRGGRLQVLIGDPGETLFNAIGRSFEADGGMALDGAYLFLHHPAPPLADIFRRLQETATLAYMPKGFFEDELIMLANAAANFGRHSFRLIPGDGGGRRPETLFLIAAGPSLDQDLEHIRRLRRRAMVISCGTALQPCLSAGIVPDYHAELENVATVYDILSRTGARHDLSTVTLLCSATVDPRCPPLFGDTLLFFRDRSVSTRLFGPGQEITLAAPNVTNAALRLGVALGFSRFVLFGTDCGTRGERKHAAGTSYEIDGVAAWYEPSLRFTIPVPANFGGTSHTDAFLNWSRKVLSRIATKFGIDAVNCSDGALIEGIRPCRAADLVVTGPDLDHRLVKTQVAAGLPDCRPGQLVTPELLGRFAADAEALFDRLLGETEAAAAAGTGLEAAWGRLIETVADPTGANLAVPMLRGSLDSFRKASMHVIARLPADPRRAGLEQAILLGLGGILRRCREQLAARIDAVATDGRSATAAS
jgi:hypothetical protein